MDRDPRTEVDFRWGHHDAWSPDSTGREEPEQTDQDEEFGEHRLMFLPYSGGEEPWYRQHMLSLSAPHPGKMNPLLVASLPEKRFPLSQKCVILRSIREK